MKWRGFGITIGLVAILTAGVAQAQALPDVIPLFPLEPAMLFPGVDRPLHIFEARYRAMVADALKGDRMIGMATLKPGFESDYAGRPPIYEVGCVGEIVSVEELPGGRYNIVLRGLAKFRVTSEDQSRAYRLARVEWLTETLSDVDTEALHKHRLRIEDLVTRGGNTKVPPGMSDEALVNMIAQYMPMDHTERQALLELKTVMLRALALIDLIVGKSARPRLQVNLSTEH
jgi:uncharacterized protein